MKRTVDSQKSIVRIFDEKSPTTINRQADMRPSFIVRQLFIYPPRQTVCFIRNDETIAPGGSILSRENVERNDQRVKG